MLLGHVTVAYNSSQELDQLFFHIGLQKEESHFIICIDNSDIKMKKENRAICEKYNLMEDYTIEYYSLNKNLGSAMGFAIAMTLGYNAGAEYIWLHDQDGYPTSNCLQNVKKYLDEGFSLVSPKILDENNSYLFTFHGNYDNSWHLNPIVFNEGLGWAEVAGTAGLFVSRDLIDKIGVYDYKNYFIGNEDYDYCLRAKSHGVKVLVVESAEYHHPNKWGVLRIKKNRNKSLYFGDIKPGVKGIRDRSIINYNVKHCSYRFLSRFIYSISKAILKKIFLKPINIIATSRCYRRALSSRLFGSKMKIIVDPTVYI